MKGESTIVKYLAKLILAFTLLVGIVSIQSPSANAATVTPGFYINNVLDLSLVEFQKKSKADKKKYIAKAATSKLVMGNTVYDFKTVLTLPAGVNPTGVTVAEYEKNNGPLVSNVTDTPFEVIGIE